MELSTKICRRLLRDAAEVRVRDAGGWIRCIERVTYVVSLHLQLESKPLCKREKLAQRQVEVLEPRPENPRYRLRIRPQSRQCSRRHYWHWQVGLDATCSEEKLIMRPKHSLQGQRHADFEDSFINRRLKTKAGFVLIELPLVLCLFLALSVVSL